MSDVLTLLQLSSCFRDTEGNLLVCPSLPCACAQSLHDEIAKPLNEEIERLRALVQALLDNDPDDMAADGVTVLEVWRKEARAILGQKEAADVR